MGHFDYSRFFVAILAASRDILTVSIEHAPLSRNKPAPLGLMLAVAPEPCHSAYQHMQISLKSTLGSPLIKTGVSPLQIQRTAVIVMSSMPALEASVYSLAEKCFPAANVVVYGRFEHWMSLHLPPGVSLVPCDPSTPPALLPPEVDLLHFHSGAKTTEEGLQQAVERWLPCVADGGYLAVSAMATESVYTFLRSHLDSRGLTQCSSAMNVRLWRKENIATSAGPLIGANLFLGTPPAFGVVIGTFAAIPYVHLQLEARCRHYPHVRMLIHDDASPRGGQLRELADRYSADFVSTHERLRHFTGDVSAFCHGLQWAKRRDLEVLVKLSRRFLPLDDWTVELTELARKSQYPTYSGWCDAIGFGFLTECLAMHVDSWHAVASEQLAREVQRDSGSCFVESFVHDLARQVLSAVRCEKATLYEANHPMASDRHSYCEWPLLRGGRTRRNDRRLWHDCNSPSEYFELAQAWNLPYSPDDFNDPNEGYGAG